MKNFGKLVTLKTFKSIMFMYNLMSPLYKQMIFFQAQNGFDELRRYVKQGSDFSKELAVILQER